MARGAFILVAALGMTAFAGVGGFMFAASDYPKLERYPPYSQTGEDRPEPDRAIAAKQPEAERDKQPCRNPESREESDLCAQWVAANAARENVIWTERGFWIGVLTAFGLGFTILLTFRAVRSGEESLAHARQVAKLELRPWLSFANLKIHRLNMIRPEEGHEGEDWIIAAVIEVEIINSGPTPAKDIRVLAHVVDNPLEKEAAAEVEHWAKHQMETNRGFPLGLLPPGGTGLYKYAVPCCVRYYEEGGAERRNVFPGVALAMIYRGFDDETLRQTVQVFRLSNADPKLHTDTPQANGFWLTHTSYADHAITIIAGNKLDRAT